MTVWPAAPTPSLTWLWMGNRKEGTQIPVVPVPVPVPMQRATKVHACAHTHTHTHARARAHTHTHPPTPGGDTSDKMDETQTDADPWQPPECYVCGNRVPEDFQTCQHRECERPICNQASCHRIQQGLYVSHMSEYQNKPIILSDPHSCTNCGEFEPYDSSVLHGPS